jgi:hypothetical protein
MTAAEQAGGGTQGRVPRLAPQAAAPGGSLLADWHLDVGLSTQSRLRGARRRRSTRSQWWPEYRGLSGEPRRCGRLDRHAR